MGDNPLINWYGKYEMMINQCGHTAYHNLARRRVRFFEREQKIFEYFSARMVELEAEGE